MIRSRRVLAAGVAAVIFAASAPAAADWPMSRCDAQRTAGAHGKGNITLPEKSWRYPLGGSLGLLTQGLVTDATGDGVPEFFFIRGSAALSKRLDDSEIWRSPSMGLNAITALADLDGDGLPEMVAPLGTNQVVVLDMLGGAVDWIEPAADLGFRSSTLVRDITGDGIPELLVQDCGCCAQIGSIPGAVYSFKGDVKSPKMLWKLPYAACGGGFSTTLLDLDGDGVSDVLMGRADGFDLLDGPTGAVKAKIQYGSQLQLAQCVPAKISGFGEQAVCVYGNSTSDDSGHRVFALGYTATPAPAITVLWDRKLGNADYAVAMKPGLVSDLDGDGFMEAVVAAKTGNTTWSTSILDAASGAILATIDGPPLIGAVPITSGGQSLILTEDAAGFSAWAFRRKPSPTVTKVWSLSDQGPIVDHDWALSTRAFPYVGLLTVDLTGDGVADLITADAATGALRVIDAAAAGNPNAPAPPKIAGAGTTPPSAGLIWTQASSLGGKPILVSGWSDGVFHLQALQDGALADITGGVHFDGYYTNGYWLYQDLSPVAASLAPGQAATLLVSDANGTLHAVDASFADATTPPKTRWSIPKTRAPIVVKDLLLDKPGVVAVQAQPGTSYPPKKQVVALDGDGVTLWVSPLDGNVVNDLVAGHLDGDGVGDVVVNWTSSSDGNTTLRTRAISGKGGVTLWDGPTFPPANFTGSTLFDWNGDGRDDVFYEFSGLHVLSGVNGAPIGPAPAEKTENALPIVADVTHDGAPEVVLQGGYAKATVLSSDLTQVLWASNEAQGTLQYGGIARCPSGDRLVESTAFYHTARLAITDLTPPQTGAQTYVWFAGGQMFPDEAAATAAGVFQGVLSAVSVHENITGLGHPSAVFGSTDGFLYAVDPCSIKLDFAYDFHEAVGTVAFADTDGDGFDEILVSVADGYLYDVKQHVEPGTGGAGGSGGSGGAGGSGGSGGSGAGGSGGAGAGDPYLLYGRASCYCAAASERGDGALGTALAGLALAAAAARRRSRSRRA